MDAMGERQMSDYLEKMKEMVHKAGPFRIAAVIVSGVLLLLLSCGNVFSKPDKKEEPAAASESAGQPESELTDYKEQMETQVKEILERVEGVGAVDVMITLKSSREKVTLKDNSANADKSEEKSVLIEDENNNTAPYIVQEVEPEIEGILVVCGGGADPGIQREIIAGISALFPVESHKIKVMKSKEAKK